MRGRKLLILAISCFVGLLIVAVPVAVWRSSVLSQRIEESYAKLDDADAQERLRAANFILERQPMDELVRLVQAEALIEMGRPTEARYALSRLMDDRSPNLGEALILKARSFLVEAQEVVRRTRTTTFDLAQQNMTQIAAEIDVLCSTLGTMPGHERVISMLEAQKIDLVTTLLQMELDHVNLKLHQAQSVEMDQHVQDFGGLATELQGRIDTLDQRLAALCEQALAIDPSDPQPHLLLFRKQLRAGAFDQARTVARRIAAQPSLQRELAGTVANTLLNIESLYITPSRPQDVLIAQSLLDHPQLVDDPHVEHDLARVNLALRLGNHAMAEALANQLLKSYPGHPIATSQLATALIGQGKAERAVTLMQTLLDRVEETQSYHHRHVLGAAYLAAGRDAQGRETLRRVLEIKPDFLPSLLLIAESLVEQGHVLEAGPDIRVLEEICPEHPRLISLTARLLVEGRSGGDLVRFIRQGLNDTATAPSVAAQVALAAAMSLDDTAQVLKLLADQQIDNDNSFIRLAQAWRRATADQRRLVAATVVQTLLDHIDVEPLLLPEPLQSVRAEPVHVVQPLADTSGQLTLASNPQIAVSPLRTTWYVNWPEQSALELIVLGLEKFPDHQVLLMSGAQLYVMLDRPDDARPLLAKLTGKNRGHLAAALTALIDGQHEQALRGLHAMTPDEFPGSIMRSWIPLVVAVGANDTAATEQALRQLLTEHPWCEQAALFVLRDAVVRGDPARGDRWIGHIEQLNPMLAHLCRARYSLAIGQPGLATRTLDLMIHQTAGSQPWVPYAADARVRAMLTMGQVEQAVGMFEHLALSVSGRRAAMRVAAADAARDGDNPSAAVGLLAAVLTDTQTSVRYSDHALSRLLLLAPAEETLKVIDDLMRTRAHDSLLQVYRAAALAKLGRVDDAQRLLRELIQIRPQALRARLHLARYLVTQRQWNEAESVYRELADRGGWIGEVAARELQQMRDNAKPAGSPADVPATEAP